MCRQLQQRPAAGIGFEIQGQAALAGVQIQMPGAVLHRRGGVRGVIGVGVGGERAQPAQRVARRRALHLDHVRPQPGQQPGAVGAGEIVRQVQCLDAVQ